MICIVNQYKYNELEYAERIYKNGFQTSHLLTEMRLLVIYYKQILGYKPKQRREQLLDFCKDYIPMFDRAKYYKLINQSLRQADKANACLVVVDKIEIYRHEMEYLEGLNLPYHLKKVLFTFLVQWKINSKISQAKNKEKYNTYYFKGGKAKYNILKKMSNISDKYNINIDIIGELASKEYILIYHNGLIVLDFLKNCMNIDKEQESDVAFSIVGNYQDIGYWFDYYALETSLENDKKNIDFCECCGSAFKKKKNVQKYCSEDCANKQKSIQDHKRYIEKVSNFTL